MPTDFIVHEMYKAYIILNFKETIGNELFYCFWKVWKNDKKIKLAVN